jgi:hypothetical protein
MKRYPLRQLVPSLPGAHSSQGIEVPTVEGLTASAADRASGGRFQGARIESGAKDSDSTSPRIASFLHAFRAKKP